ncbi:hypothetical protein EVAR_69211_1 [Eumeta japonica]|uniref:Uncharacterized protein n=1 Tax=Eumeta variegata TaxID=151549 RepID=A0A4C1ZZA4_EUMVA|nr:hypothetical protein EVAR_69211_1 [Eumeta japonica]
MDAKIVSWIEEMSDFENTTSKFVDDNVSKVIDLIIIVSITRTQNSQQTTMILTRKKLLQLPCPLKYRLFYAKDIYSESSRSRSPVTMICHQPRSRRRKRTIQPGDKSQHVRSLSMMNHWTASSL